MLGKKQRLWSNGLHEEEACWVGMGVQGHEQEVSEAVILLVVTGQEDDSRRG